MITKDFVIELAMSCMGWPRARAISWYKTENRWFNGNSPKELVQRDQGQVVVDFLEARKNASNGKTTTESDV